MRRLILLLAAAMTGFWSAPAQPAITGTEVLPLGVDHRWSMPQWSPDGSAIFYTTAACNGIWKYSVRTREVVQVTSDLQAGYGFSISPDGQRVAYRRTVGNAQGAPRIQEAVVKNIADGSEVVLASAPDVSLPAFARSDPVTSIGGRPTGVTDDSRHGLLLLGTEENKIVLLRDGVKVVLDPLGGDGRYIWPALAPGGDRLFAHDMERGSFVADADGTHPRRIGRRDAAVWTRDGRWLVYMDDRDDGERMTGSEIACVSPDGKVTVALTATAGKTELFPRCSPVDDLIVCGTLEGEIILMRYAEGGR